MKKTLLLALVLMIQLLTHAQDIKSLYIAMPDSLSPLLTKVNRADFADFLGSGMKAQVKNRFGQLSEMKQLTADFLLVQVSRTSTLQLKLLPLTDSTRVICCVETFYGPVPDSRIAFYDTSWKQLPSERFIHLPSEDDFYNKPQGTQQADSLHNLRLKADLCLMEFKLSPNQPTLEVCYKTPDYLDSETAQALRPFLHRQPVVYRWTKASFLCQEMQ